MSNLVNKFFQHRNGKYYYVLNVSKHTESMENLVNYIQLYSTHSYPYGSVWSRPLKMWDEIVDGKPRFIECSPPKHIMDDTFYHLKYRYDTMKINVEKE